MKLSVKFTNILKNNMTRVSYKHILKEQYFIQYLSDYEKVILSCEGQCSYVYCSCLVVCMFYCGIMFIICYRLYVIN